MARKEFAQAVMIKNAGQFGLGMFAWWVVGYAFATGNPDGGFLGHKYWAGDEWRSAGLGCSATLFGLVGISVLYIINGAVAERTQVLPYLLYSFFVMVFAWPVVVAWGWGGGWLKDMDVAFEDMGGVSTVHVFSGSFALVSCILLGSRSGRWTRDPNIPEFKYSSPPFLAAGSLLYFIHLCFLNSLMAPTLVAKGRAVFNTWLCAGSCALTTTLLGTLTTKSVERHFVTVMRGFIAGAVLIAGVGWNVDGWAAFTFGVFGGFFLLISVFLVEMLRLDDVTHSISVHFTMGLVGTFGVGLWDNDRGGFHNNDGELIGSQLAGELAMTAWAAVWAAAIFGLCRVVGILRVPESVQTQGFAHSSVSLKGFESEAMQVVPNHDPGDLSRARPDEASQLHDVSQGVGNTAGQ